MAIINPSWRLKVQSFKVYYNYESVLQSAIVLVDRKSGLYVRGKNLKLTTY